MADPGYHLVSLKHSRNSPDVVLWRPDAQGYCRSPVDAGSYAAGEISDRPDYFNNGSRTIAVPAAVVHALAVAPPGDPRNAGRTIPNTPGNMELLVAAAAHASMDLDGDAAWGGDRESAWSRVMGEMSGILSAVEPADAQSAWRLRCELAGLCESRAPDEALEEVMESARALSPSVGPSPRG